MGHKIVPRKKIQYFRVFLPWSNSYVNKEEISQYFQEEDKRISNDFTDRLKVFKTWYTNLSLIINSLIVETRTASIQF